MLMLMLVVNLSDVEIRQAAEKLIEIYPNDLEFSLCDELMQFKSLAKLTRLKDKDKIGKEIQMHRLSIENGLTATFTNVSVVLRMYLCLMVSNCSGERSFSAFKRIKSHIRSTMRQSTSAHLSRLCIENNVLDNINTSDIIREFAHRKSRKAVLGQ
ncbi:Uncharacterised protein at_DN2649 [Pycnogonum litorale]